MNDLEELQRKLDDIQAQRKSKEKTTEEKAQSSENMNVGLRAGSELVVSIVAGAMIGLWLDAEFGTKPIFLLALLFLGIITGFVNVWRTTQGIGYAVGYAKKDTGDNKEENT